MLQTKSNSADGSVAFDAVEYTLDDIGEHIYTISEVEGTLGGITYDKGVRTVTVTVSDNGDGTLDVSATVRLGDAIAEGLSFINTYTAKGSVTFKVDKVLTGHSLMGKKFDFELWAVDGEGKRIGDVPLQTVTNRDDGTVTFEAIDYTEADAGKTYTYTINEVGDVPAGYTYDNHTLTATVTVIDNGDGTLKTKVTTVGDTTFTNAYAASGSVQFEVSKTLSGRTLVADQFAFDLKSADGAVLQTKKNAADGSVTFDAISYTHNDVGQTFIYTISEKNEGKAGYSYDDHVLTATVAVTDNGDGTLKTDVFYEDERTTFANEYKASGSWTPSVSKHLAGRDLVAGEFNFELRSADGEVLQTKPNMADGSVAFDSIAYTEADIGKTFTYTIAEVGGEVSGVTYDKDIRTVTVTVTDNGDGTLNVSAAVRLGDAIAGALVFMNTYIADGSVSFEVNKVLIGRELVADQFSFELKDAAGNVLQTKKNAADGIVDFDAIEYTLDDVGEHVYTISEVGKAPAGYTYDGHAVTAIVTVTDKGDGTLETALTYKGDRTFANTYTASGEAQFEVNKVLNGRTLVANQFSFELRDAEGTVLQTKKNAADGTVSFDALNYTEADAGKTYTYTITEKNNGRAGYTYDEHVLGIRVAVSDNGDGTLATEVVYEGDQTFTNQYAAEGVATLAASKSLSGHALGGGIFAFELRDANGNVLQTVSNTADGSIIFAPIAYTHADAGKTFTYTITEKNEGAPGYTYDDHTLTATVTVADEDDDTLDIAVSYEGEQTFTNTYKATGQAQIDANTVLIGRALEPKQFAFELKDSTEEATPAVMRVIPDLTAVIPAAAKGASSEPLETVRNAADGTVVFAPLTYTEADIGKTFTYTLTEIDEGAPGYTYDGHTLTVTVMVSDNGDGTLATSVAYAGDRTFTNYYNAQGTATIEVAKTLTGKAIEAEQFSFDLKDAAGEILQTVMNDADGTIAFDAIEYTEADVGKTFTYTVTEKNEGKTGYTYDGHTLTVTVIVSDNGDGTLKADVSYEGEQIFANTYKAPEEPTPDVPTEVSAGPLVTTGAPVLSVLVFGGLLAGAGLLLVRQRKNV